ncbi:MAG: hypothetical protein AAF988_08935 [Pseudomonadota bacterium]
MKNAFSFLVGENALYIPFNEIEEFNAFQKIMDNFDYDKGASDSPKREYAAFGKSRLRLIGAQLTLKSAYQDSLETVLEGLNELEPVAALFTYSAQDVNLPGSDKIISQEEAVLRCYFAAALRYHLHGKKTGDEKQDILETELLEVEKELASYPNHLEAMQCVLGMAMLESQAARRPAR